MGLYGISAPHVLKGEEKNVRKKFKIMYPNDHHDSNLAGKPFKPDVNCMVVMNGSGVFFHFASGVYGTTARKLSEVLHKYDVVWK